MAPPQSPGSSASSASSITGIGLGLRWEFLREAQNAALPTALRFFEFAPENYMRRGGHPVAALSQIAERRALLSHGLMLNLGGHDPLDTDYLASLRGLLDQFGIDAHSDHLCWSAHAGRCLHELLPLAWTPAGLERCAERLAFTQASIGRRMSVENISAYAQVHGASADAPQREAAFMHALLERCDAGLLLDVNNVWVNAQNHDFDAWAFIESLPLDRVTQLHVAGGEQVAGMHGLWIDTHGCDVPPPVVELMQRVVERVGPVPVLYERDNAIPSFAQLLHEVSELDLAYQAALRRHGLAGDASAAPGRPPSARNLELPSWQLGAQAEDHAPLAQACLREAALGADANLPGFAAPAPAVYRGLVRGTLASPIRNFFPRTAARLGLIFDDCLSRFVAQGLSSSPYLRDVPAEFAAFCAPAVAGLAAYLPELMQHELVAYEVAAAPSWAAIDVAGEGPGLAFGLGRGVRLDPSARLRVGAFAVHELSIALEDRSAPPQRETRLLVYRDAQFKVRYLELTAFAHRLVGALLRGATLEAAVREACAQPSGALPSDALERCNAVLATLVERGVLRAAA